jgi:ABC-type sugar transport system ATPase subunit/ribose/xylose/arabinose/galactoside ABC-type transport system permease subunit
MMTKIALAVDSVAESRVGDGLNTMLVQQAAIECRGVCKSFPGVQALDHVDLSIRQGEIHALVGQNGAGKSTLVKILTGVYALDEGLILVNGKEAVIACPSDAQANGIAIVHQDQQLVQQFDVTRNMFLGSEWIGRTGILKLREMRARTAALLKRVGASFGPDALIKDLSVAQRAQVAIAAALLRDSRVLILDEPTASMSNQETERLFEIIRSLRLQGVTIIYISHYLDEVFELVDRISVVRDGKLMGTKVVGETSRMEIIKMMIGRELQQLYPKESVPIGETLVDVRNLTQGDRVRGVTFAIRSGEILGIAGIMGAGRTELALTLIGALRRSGGEVTLSGAPSAPRSPSAAKRQGFALIPEDRRHEGLVTDISVRDNLTLPNISKWSRLGFLRLGAEREAAMDLVRRLHIEPPNISPRTRNLSGGNQQKIVIGRWLTGNAKVFIFDEPTTGVDVGSRVEIYKQMTELTKRGAAILLISSDFDELLGMADRIAVMHKGRLNKVFEDQSANLQNLVYWATGGEQPQESANADQPKDSTNESAGGAFDAGPPARLTTGKLFSRWGTIAGMILALLAIGVVAPEFFAPNNIFDVLKQGSVLALIALGLTAILISGGFDMSAGAGSQLAANVAAGAIIQGLGTVASVALGCLAGLTVGGINAGLVILLRMPAFVATLGSMFVVMGATLFYNGGHALTLYDQPAFFFLGQGYIGPMPFVVIILMLVTALLHLIYKHTRVGLHMYAVGENLAAANLCGVSRSWAVAWSFAIGGLVIGLAGAIIASYSYGASALATGIDFLISAVAAAFLGSTLSRTGELDIVGTAIAAIFLASLSNGLILIGVSNLALAGIQGTILILAILPSVIHKREIGQITIF